MKILTAYFSASGVTAKAATKLSEMAKTDLFEIKPITAYTSADLDWTNAKSRSSVEMKSPSFRPEISKRIDNMEEYDTVLLCFPIWWYVAPTIINTFLESYDFSDKTVILFATSGGSGFGKTVEKLKNSVSSTTKIVEGKMMNSKMSQDEIDKLIKAV